jgi:hypothetical protein
MTAAAILRRRSSDFEVLAESYAERAGVRGEGADTLAAAQACQVVAIVLCEVAAALACADSDERDVA